MLSFKYKQKKKWNGTESSVQLRAHQKAGAGVLLPKPTSSAQQPIQQRNRSSQTPSTNIICTLHISLRVCTMHKMLSGRFASKVFQEINS